MSLSAKAKEFSPHSARTPTRMNANAEKAILLIGMAIATIAFAFIPFKLVAGPVEDLNAKWRKILSFSSCFSGGVFIAACILDLFPMTNEAITLVLDQLNKTYGISIDFPVAEFVICFGFFLILIIEQIILEYRKQPLQHQVVQPIQSGCGLPCNGILGIDAENGDAISNTNGYGTFRNMYVMKHFLSTIMYVQGELERLLYLVGAKDRKYLDNRIFELTLVLEYMHCTVVCTCISIYVSSIIRKV